MKRVQSEGPKVSSQRYGSKRDEGLAAYPPVPSPV